MTKNPEQRCPLCRDFLEVVSVRHGVILACVRCQGGATTLAVLRRVAPREFVNHVWQAAQKHGQPSDRLCPSCNNPLLELREPDVAIDPRIDVCLPCFFVWLGPDALKHARIAQPKQDDAARDALLQVALEAGANKELQKGESLILVEAVLWALYVAG